MSEQIQYSDQNNRLLDFSRKRPVLVVFVLFLLAYSFKILDSFILRLDELLGEAILTKALGFGLVALYIWISKKKLSDIGFHTRNLGKSLLISAVSFIGLYIVAFGAQLISLRAGGENAKLVLAAVDPKTGMAGGFLFAIWLLLANLVNSAMEEGLFRGLMIRHLLLRYSAWGSILFQAGLFALWHLNWPIRHLLDGDANLEQAAFEALALLLSTSIAGIVWGYLYLKTDNLWPAFLAHALNNGIFNVLFFQTSVGMQAGTEFGLFLAIFLMGYLALLLVFRLTAKRLKLPEVTPWGQHEEHRQV